MTEATREARCACGQLSATCAGEPLRISVCHCLDCQRRTGAAFGVQARFLKENVRIAGEYRSWTRVADSGTEACHHFCPNCGLTLFYENADQPDRFAVALGAFADPDFPAPRFSVYESRKHGWVAISGEGIERDD